MDKDLKDRLQGKMDKAVGALKKDYGSIRTGRASLVLLDGIAVDYYGTPTPLNQVSTLSVPDPKTIAIQPWEPKIIGDIEKAIMKSDLDLTPTNDGKIIRINIPPLTEERRKQLVKLVKKKAEECRVSIRNIRRDVNEELKKIEKDEHISEDETKKSLDEVQKMTDNYVKKIEEVLQHKEKEITEV